MSNLASSNNKTLRKEDRRKNSVVTPFEDRRFLDRRAASLELEKGSVVPRFPDNYSAASLAARREWLKKKTGQDLDMFSDLGFDSHLASKNIENCVGATRIPLAVIGPVAVNGKYARGSFYVPMATTQGTLVESYHRGALICAMSGGINSVAYKDGVHITPSFIFNNLHASLKFIVWLREHEDEIRAAAENTTRYGKLIRIVPFLMGRMVLLNLWFKTGDASGLNMINIASDAVCRMIADKVGPERYFLRSNFSSDKKVSFFNQTASYGKEVMAEALLTKQILKRFMRTTAEDMFAFWYQAFIASATAGMVGPNAHFANAFSAIFLATGQDIAQVVNASSGTFMLEAMPNGDLRVYCRFPQLIVGTVGGGIPLPFQRRALEMMGCYGEGKALKLAEIMAAVALAGEVSISGALSSGEFAAADLALRKREK